MFIPFLGLNNVFYLLFDKKYIPVRHTFTLYACLFRCLVTCKIHNNRLPKCYFFKSIDYFQPAQMCETVQRTHYCIVPCSVCFAYACEYFTPKEYHMKWTNKKWKENTQQKNPLIDWILVDCVYISVEILAPNQRKIWTSMSFNSFMAIAIELAPFSFE